MVLLNPGRTGFYTTLYDGPGYERLASNFPHISPYDRSGILNDLYLFLAAEMVPPELYARFVSLCAASPDAMTAQIVGEQLTKLTAIAAESPIIARTNQGFYPPLLQAFGEVPKPGERESVGATREYLTSGYALVNGPYANRMAGHFDQFENLDPNIRAAVAVGYAITNGARAKKPLQDLVKSTQSEVDRAKVWEGLCSFKEPELVEETLELGISGEVSRSDSGYPLLFSAFNPLARDVLWRWITKRYDKMREIYAGSQQFYLFMGHAIPACAVEHEPEVGRFLSGKRLIEGGSSAKRILEALRINARLRGRLLRPAK